jgi:hypothetical protein
MLKEQFASYLEHRSRVGLQRVQETDNPLYVWQTIEEFAGLGRFLTEAGAKAWKNPHAMTALPNWVLWHLAQAAEAFAAMGRGHAPDSEEDPRDVPAAGEETITPATALAEALHVLGLTRQGWNAFGAMRRDQLRDNAAGCIEFDDAPAEVCRYLGIQTDRSLRRELAKQRRKPLSRNGSCTDSCKRK